MMLIPGPVEVPESVLRASAYVANHRSQEFREIMKESESLLNGFANSTRSVITTGSGTTAVESMIYSMTRPGDHVIAVTYGEFGNRLIESLKRRGLKTSILNMNIDRTLEMDEISVMARRNPDAQSIFLVHNETGNGTSIHNLEKICRESKKLGLKVMVDSVSGFGGIPINVNAWGIDAMATCSQKGLASVPGLGIVSLGKEAAESLNTPPDVPQYLDLGISLKFLNKNETPYTPSTGSFRALLEALHILRREGIERRWQRHHANASFLRRQLGESGAEILGSESTYSDTVIAFRPAKDVTFTLEALSQKGIVVSRGMGALSDSIIRVGNVGMVDGRQICQFLNSYFQISGIHMSADVSELPPESFVGKNVIEENAQDQIYEH